MKSGKLTQRLLEYSKSDFYGFHMPGHKRQVGNELLGAFPNPFSVDITEIEGFDNLHHAKGILKESMERAASVYGADKTYYLINGSSSGLLSAICGSVDCGNRILISRNCHKAVYHGIFLGHLKTAYVYPQIIKEYGIQGGILPEDIDVMLKTYGDIRAVLLVSPTYDGVVSDIRLIAEIVHRYGIPLIVDEAHGAHFSYGCQFPDTAIKLGADIVVQSLHKTLPSLTQTALLHIREGYVKSDEIERYLQIYQTSSPSYVFMSAMESCIEWMDDKGRIEMDLFGTRLTGLRSELIKMRSLKLVDEALIGLYGIFDIDKSKIVISTVGTGLNGMVLADILRDKYHLEMELCGSDYVVALTSVMDSEEGLLRLQKALMEIDNAVSSELLAQGVFEPVRDAMWMDLETGIVPNARMTIFEAVSRKKEIIKLQDSAGKISGEYIYIYPPGIPMIVPGEVIGGRLLHLVEKYQGMGLPVQGLRDDSMQWIEIVND